MANGHGSARETPPPMQRGRRRTPESAVTLEIRSYLARCGYIELTGKSLGTADVVLQNDPALRDTPGVFWRNSVGAATNSAGRLCRFGIPGMPDIWLIRRGRDKDGRLAGQLIAIEIKGPRGKLSDQQALMRRILEHCGVSYILATGPDSLARAGL